ncbi:MAG: hypothetical protein H5T42_00015 [Methanothrix sp.]|jgi:hypothetical protein|uniref:hypothetical protein n=1 Tax=Methanothrix sp. TaxID=90426 RepID=UPI00199E9555|nr:hypothetical protein [Methanothrix sp.]MBC7078856.1 hypothetical protein [Methanothrix sp.]NPU87019.1 hypothetical protein [Methanothrix sp.]
MWKYLGIVAALFVLAGLGAASECVDCYANIVTQSTTQATTNTNIDLSYYEKVGVVNEGLLAGVIVTDFDDYESEASSTITPVAFGRIDQSLTQTISGNTIKDAGNYMNKEISAAWIQGQGRKEFDPTVCPYDPIWAGVIKKEGAYVSQATTQTLSGMAVDCVDPRVGIVNADNKLAMIVDDMNRVISLTANAASSTNNNAASTGTVTNTVTTTTNSNTIVNTN